MKSSYRKTRKWKSRVKKNLSRRRRRSRRSVHNTCIKKLKLNVPILKRKKSKRKSRRKSRIKRKSRTYDGSGKGKKCKKWERIPDREMSNYDVSIRRCKNCENVTSFPYIVHSSGKEEESLDYDCYKCGKDVDVRYMCMYCIKDK